MKTRIINIMLSAAALSVFAACNQEDVNKFDSDARIYFAEESRTEFSTPRDNINHTFITVPDDKDTYDVEVEVKAVGFPVDYPRAITFRQIFPEGKGYADGTPVAVAGEHYLPFDDQQVQARMFMPAGKVKANVPVTLIRNPELMDGNVRLEFELVANEYFNLGIQKNLIFSINSTSQYTLPKLWDGWWKPALGEWGHKKMWFLVQIVGIHPSVLDEISSVGYRKSKQTQAIEKLEEYNKNPDNDDTPLKEANGTLVTFPGM